jgi:uncharacterized membrane protein
VLPESAPRRLEQLRHMPGLGVLVMVLLLLLTGVFAANIFGQWWLRQWDAMLGKIPIVKSIYSSVKQVSTRCFPAAATPSARPCWCSTRARAPGPSPSSPASRAARWPRTCRVSYVSLYVPTTPNPTSGFFLMMPRADVLPLRMSVDEALKYIISMGVVGPRRQRAGRAANPLTGWKRPAAGQP